jgi:hypothetical protein
LLFQTDAKAFIVPFGVDGGEPVVRTPGEPTAACDFSLIGIIESRISLLQGLLQVRAKTIRFPKIHNALGSWKPIDQEKSRSFIEFDAGACSYNLVSFG